MVAVAESMPIEDFIGHFSVFFKKKKKKKGLLNLSKLFKGAKNRVYNEDAGKKGKF